MPSKSHLPFEPAGYVDLPKTITLHYGNIVFLLLGD